MKEFILTYWRDILSVVILLLSILLWLLKKPASSSLESDIVSDLSVCLPQWMNAVEVPGDGANKKDKVISTGLRFVAKKFGRSLTDDELSIWTKRIGVLVESIGSTPQFKKGAKK